MAETTADVRRDIEQTRARMSTTLTELEQRLNVVEIVREHPWPALALAFGAGLALSASGTDTKAAVATLAATKGSSSKIDSALQDRIDGWVGELKSAIGAPGRSASSRRSGTVASSGGYGTGPADDLSRMQPSRAD
jgi:hypothetical protein